MRCTEAREMISPFTDGELSPEASERFLAHVAQCRSCRHELEETRQLHALFSLAERYPAPSGFASRIMANLKEEPQTFWTFFKSRPPLLKVVEVVFAVFIIIVGILSGNFLITNKGANMKTVQIEESFSLDLFQAEPPGSIGHVYACLTGGRDER